MLKRLREAGKRHSQTDMQAIQGIHDMSVQAGADCPGMQESWPPMADAATIHESSGLSQSDLAALLRTALGDRYPNRGVYLRDVYGDSVVFTVYQDGNDGTYEAPYALSDPDGDGIPEKATIGNPVEVMSVTSYVPVAEAVKVTKSEGDAGGFPAAAYAYVPDASMPSTWKLRLWATPSGGPDSGIVGAAVAALGKGFRGQKVDIPTADLPVVKAKVRAAWTKANPDKAAADMPDAIKEAAGEPIELTGDTVELVERAVNKSTGQIRAKLISPGVGSSGYYSPKTLEAAAPKFAGAQVYWDHPSASEAKDRPERSLRDLAGKVGAPAWDPNGATGPGIYADVQVFKPYQEAVEELAPHIGMSIRAVGTAGTAEVDGKKLRSIESIDDVYSVDFVTVPGRGGEILQLFESARSGHRQPSGGDGMNLEEALARIAELEAAKPDALAAQRLGEANQRIETLEREKARLQEQTILRDAEAVIAETLAGFELHQMTRDRVAKDLMRDFPVRDGALDKEAFAARVTEAAKAEQNYLIVSTGSNGRVRGMGGGANGEPDYDAELAALYEAQGYGKEIAARMAR